MQKTRSDHPITTHEENPLEDFQGVSYVRNSVIVDVTSIFTLTYLRSYVNNMLKNHPHGETFKDIRFLARYVQDYEPPTPDPDEEEQTNAQKTLYTTLNIVLSILGGGPSRSDIKRKNLPRYYEELKQKMSELMDVLDCSEDSIWLATYMIEEGVPVCPYAVNFFEKYLEKCT